MSFRHLFFLDNRLEPGIPALEGRGRVPLSDGLSYAVQLVNAGLACKEAGWMPSRMDPRLVQVTRSGWLFIPPEHVDRIPFEEVAFCARMRSVLRSLLTMREELDDSEHLEELLQNYPRPVTRAIDGLTGDEQSLIHFKWRILEACDSVEPDWHLMTFEFENPGEVSDPSTTLLLRSGPLWSAWTAHTHTLLDCTETSSIPFGCYDRFARTHPHFQLPVFGSERLATPESLFEELDEWTKSSHVPKESTCFAVHEETLDPQSFESFRRISTVFALRLVVLTDEPFASRWDDWLESGIAAVWNPRVSSGIQVTSSVLSHFHLLARSAAAARMADNTLALFLLLMEQLGAGVKNTAHPPVFIQELRKSGKANDDLQQRKGLVGSGNCPLPCDCADLENISDRILAMIRKGPDSRESLIELLDEHPDPGCVMLSGENDGLNPVVRSLLYWHAQQYDRAAQTFLSLNRIPGPVLPWAADALLKAGMVSEMFDICEKAGFDCSALQFGRFQRGEPIATETLEPEHRFEYLLMHSSLDELEIALGSYADQRGWDSLALEMKGAAELIHNPEAGLSMLKQALKQACSEGSLFRQALILKRIGNAHFRRQHFIEAEACYLSAMELQASLGNQFQYDTVSYNLAMVAINLCRLDRAEDVIRRDLKRNRTEGNQLYTLFNLKALAKIQAFRSHYSEAAVTLDEAEKLARDNGFTNEMPGIHYMRVSVQIGLGRLDEAERELQCLGESIGDEIPWRIQRELLRADLLRRSGDGKGLRDTLSRLRNMELGEDDERYVAVLECLADDQPLAHVVDLFNRLDQTGHVQFRMFSRIWLLDRYPELCSLVDESVLESEWRSAAEFNREFARAFQKHLVERRRGMLVPRFMEMLTRLVRHAREREPASFDTVLNEIGDWLGTGALRLRQWEPGFSDEERPLVRDSRGSLFLEAESVPDDQSRAVLQLMVDTLAGVGIPRIAEQLTETTDRCPYLAMIVGQSKPIRELKDEIGRASGFPFPVLIRGESGTGKELAARAIHFCSDRKNRPFLAVNCAALPEHLIESELFGHTRGAFTGAVGSRQGLLEAAGSGTVFLDEIGEMPLTTQVKLLRVLQEREFYRLGETKSRTVDARFLFATNRDLETGIRSGEFREDLYYRISGFTITLPPLNERREDIPLLCTHFLANLDGGQGKQLSVAAEALIQQHAYRGNVRELQNILMASLVNSGKSPEILPEHLPEYVNPVEVSFGGELKQATKAFQKRYLHKILEETDYNNSKTGRILGITRQRVIQLRKEFGL